MGTIAEIAGRIDVLDFNFPAITRADYEELTSLALFGCRELNTEDNIAIFDAVHEYIFQTRRF